MYLRMLNKKNAHILAIKKPALVICLVQELSIFFFLPALCAGLQSLHLHNGLS